MTTPFTPISAPELISALNWRYATKQFDPAKKISEETWSTLEKTLVLTPSSFGLQPWKFLVIETPELREKLLGHSWGQKQVIQASHLVVFAVIKNVCEAHIDNYLKLQAEVQGKPVESLAGYRKVIVQHLGQFSEAARLEWAEKQAYIALGNFMTASAVLGVDVCPMEGFMRAKYDEVLGLEAQGLTSAVVATAGYRSETDKYAQSPKVRFHFSEIVERR